MAAWKQDLTHTFRRLAKSPGFAAAAVVSVGLGIAANATIFSMVSRFVLSPASVGDPGTLMALHTTHDGEQCCNQFAWPLFRDVREQAKSFSGVAAYYELVPASMGGSGEPERVWGQAATTNFFDVSQLGMTVGRGFLAVENESAVIVLSERLWHRRFHGDPDIGGKTVLLSGHPFTVVGVAPPGFRGVDIVLDTEFWVPLGNLDQVLPNTGNYQSRGYHWLAVLGRLRPGVTRAEAASELQLLAARFAQAHPETDKGGGFRFEQAGSLPPRDGMFVKLFLAALSAVVFLVLCIACANVANLMLAQVSGRRKEIAVRLALGARRRDLLRQLLTESVVLALGGGMLGIVLSLWAIGALSSFRLPAPVPLDLSLHVDWKVLSYTFALSVSAGLLFGLVPAWAASRPVIAGTLKGEDGLGSPGSRWNLRDVLVVSQIAMSLILLCATGLFLRSLQSAASIDVGFRSNGLFTMSVDPRLHGYSTERTQQFLTQLRRRVSALPGVTSAACADIVPLSMGGRRDEFHAEERMPSGSDPSVDLYMVSPGYFETLGIPRVAGTGFTRENAGSPRAAVVNEALAHMLFPQENAIGRQVSGGGRTYRIIGMVGNTRSRTLGEELSPVLYRSLDQDMEADPSFLGYSVIVHASSDLTGVASAVRREIRLLDPTLAIFNAQTMEEHLHDARFLPRLAGTLFGVFGGLGLLLSAVGLYGVMSYSVSKRTREIGIRMALGAQSAGVQRLVLRQGMMLTSIATGIGLAVAWASAKLATSILYGIQPHDVWTFTVVPLFLAAVALLACWIPSRRAAKVDPLTALRYE